MIRFFYVRLLRLHPRYFKDRYSEEMLSVFDQAAQGGGAGRLLGDAVLSLARQWALRSWKRPTSAVEKPAFDGVPVFYTCDTSGPRPVALINGAVLSLVAFMGVCLLVRYGGGKPRLLVGSHHPSPSHILPVQNSGVPTDLNAEVNIKPYPDTPPISAYFKLMPVLGALDADRDGVISAAEIANASAALRTLDKNHDGKLTAEECGTRFGKIVNPEFLEQARLGFMRFHPVLAALDADHDGEISAKEIRNAPAALKCLDRNRDGKLTENEVLPDLSSRPLLP